MILFLMFHRILSLNKYKSIEIYTNLHFNKSFIHFTYIPWLAKNLLNDWYSLCSSGSSSIVSSVFSSSISSSNLPVSNFAFFEVEAKKSTFFPSPTSPFILSIFSFLVSSFFLAFSSLIFSYSKHKIYMIIHNIYKSHKKNKPQIYFSLSRCFD